MRFSGGFPVGKHIMRNLKLTLQYDGTRYRGWQTQQGKGPTIQETLEERIEKITGVRPKLISAGRTDSGVHACGQVANFNTEHTIACDSFLRAINSIPPHDIIISHAEDVPEDFHARYRAKEKHYRYRILNSPVNDPFQMPFSWHIPYRLDMEKMKEAAKVFVGENDFTSFRGAGCGAKTTVRNLKRLKISRREDMIDLDFLGTGFLRHMVRNIVGTLVEVGRGKTAPEEVKGILAARNRCIAGPTAPAQGLFLMSVTY